MSRLIAIHPQDPQPRLIGQVVECLRGGGIVVYPTDSSYALGCHIGEREALDRIRQIRGLDSSHNFSLVCRDLSEIAVYAKVDNATYRLLKACTPGPYTFILPATRQVPRRLQHPKRKTVGLRVPDNVITQAMLAGLDEPMMSSTLVLPGEELPPTDPYEMRDLLGERVDLIIDGGYCGIDFTTVVDLTEGVPHVLRVGKGGVEVFYP
ncbi:MAG: L-threonylcarbamoyladenylate synthase [Gammaproteobacteria bacterium]|jgi:tRNA threonylcarbamoyl adenosine modification protein (Sua5/YciO/YrdC/YwlC family)